MIFIHSFSPFNFSLTPSSMLSVLCFYPTFLLCPSLHLSHLFFFSFASLSSFPFPSPLPFLFALYFLFAFFQSSSVRHRLLSFSILLPQSPVPSVFPLLSFFLSPCLFYFSLSTPFPPPSPIPYFLQPFFFFPSLFHSSSLVSSSECFLPVPQ